MKYTMEQVMAARTNTLEKKDCPEWMQRMFEECPYKETLGYDEDEGRFSNNWGGNLSFMVYRISDNWPPAEMIEKDRNAMKLSEKNQAEYEALGLPWKLQDLAIIAKDKTYVGEDDDLRFIVKAANEHHALVDKVERLREALKIAKCPNCDGSGTIAKQTRQREYVSRSMALDAGDPSLEGLLCCEDEWDFEQCQWCHEKEEALKGK